MPRCWIPLTGLRDGRMTHAARIGGRPAGFRRLGLFLIGSVSKPCRCESDVHPGAQLRAHVGRGGHSYHLPRWIGAMNRWQTSTRPALNEWAAKVRPPMARSRLAEAFIRWTASGSKYCSIRILGVEAALRVVASEFIGEGADFFVRLGPVVSARRPET